MKFLIAGLGNIGAEYELTRHNVGFLALDYVADQKKTSFSTERLAYKAAFSYKGRAFHLIKPTTYMNLSGRAVNYWMKHLDIPIENMLVIVDDVALPFGKLRMRAKGSSAGHNGLGNIELVLGTHAYPRVRFGIGDDYPKGGQVDYVLSRFSKEEFEKLPDYFSVVMEMIIAFGTMGIGQTMNLYNKR
jgi:peptidyl-tRNA hydrolase, PTH1 family